MSPSPARAPWSTEKGRLCRLRSARDAAAKWATKERPVRIVDGAYAVTLFQSDDGRNAASVRIYRCLPDTVDPREPSERVIR
jgi:hypothetical protein